MSLPVASLPSRMLLRFASLAFAMCCTSSLPAADVASVAISETPITDDDREHWAWSPLERPPLPRVANAQWMNTGVDAFILSQLEKKKLTPANSADRATLLRRLKFDLHGLPPTIQELENFETDSSPDAYEQLVERLLSDAAYGERWAQHWLDLARFAETDGFEHDKVRKDAWQYRDWVVDALNADMPYDQFVRLQLAGDLITAGSESHENSVATMFCLAGPDMPDINEQDLRRHDKLNEITSTVGAVFLAMQMHCAQCHDHKYDPISQADFYRLRAIFEPAVPAMKRDVPVHVLVDQPQPESARFYFRGEVRQPGPVVVPGLPRVAVAQDFPVMCDQQRPRTDFVDWLFADHNPLTARVMANRIWQFHFGQSLCENPSDFGVVAGEPTHPELLDWLASELRDGGWSLKHVHRTIVTSATYRQVGSASADTADWPQRIRTDPRNELYSRFPRRRLEGEIVRDALLQVSGQLNRHMRGPGVRPALPNELMETLLDGQWIPSNDPADHRRRSIYVFARRNLRYPIFDAFDRPDAGATCAVRAISTTAIQSLTLLNGELSFTAAQDCCEQLAAWRTENSQATPADWIERLMLQTLSRRPNPTEMQLLAAPLAQLAGEELDEALLATCLAILNTNEFIYID